MIRRRLLPLALIPAALVLAADAGAAGIPHVGLRVKIDPSARTATGRVRIEILNPTGAPLDHVELWRFPARLARRSPALSEKDFYWVYPYQFNPGAMAVTDVSVDGKTVSPAFRDHVQAGPGTLIDIPLPSPLAPGASVVLEATFATRVPRRYGAFGCYGGACTLSGGFYPMPVQLGRLGFDESAPPMRADMDIAVDFDPSRDRPECLIDGAPGTTAHLPNAAWATVIVAPHFADPRAGGVQSLVRIYNRGRLLTWMQDIEFSIYGFLYQAGRSGWGSAGMGGNGQFNRLVALDDIADTVGPWHDRLTEDQDLGLRLIEAGWAGRQDLGATVDQQGLPGMRRLYRQRTRWAQGNLQAMSHLPVCWRSRLTPVARLDLLAYLLMPVWQTVVGVALVAAVALVATGTTGFWLGGPWWQMGFFYLLGFGGVIMGCVARGDGLRGTPGALAGILVAQAYAFYSWILWPVLARAGTRQAIKRRGWEKTQREALGPASPPARI